MGMVSGSDLSDEQKAKIQEWADEGAALGEIQKRLGEEFELKLTFLDTRNETLHQGVSGISPDPDLRRELEGKLSVIVRKTEVVPAYLALSDETLQDPAKARTALVESGFDGAIVMRLLLADQQVHFSRPYYNDFWNYYGYAWPVVMGPTYSYTDTRIKLETLIYDLEKGDRIWAGISQTMNPSDVGDLLVQTAEAVRVDLQKEGLIE